MAEYRPGAILEDLSFPKERAPDLTNMQAPDGDLPGIVPLRDLLTPAVLAGASLSDLLEARGLIEARLPPASLKTLDLERELVLQVLALQGLQARIIGDTAVSPQHKAQTANSLSAALANLVKVQDSVYTAERLKKIEGILVSAIQSLPEETVREFLGEYERMGAAL